MSELTSLNIKMDRSLKKQADALFSAMGMTMTTAVNVFVRQAVHEQAIPFRIQLNNDRDAALRAKRAFEKARAQSIINGTADMTMEEIDSEIQAYRKEKEAHVG